jgi:galactokinase
VNHRTVQQMIEKFARAFGSADGLLCSRAPGRVNLLGEHTDYNGGFVLPMAVDREVRFFFRPLDAGPVRVWSENFGEWDEFDLDGISFNPGQPWANYVRGVARALLDAGRPLKPFEAIIHGDVPLGAGLGSSAAIEVAAALAFCAASPESLDRTELALLCQKAENDFVGVNCGIMDQFVSLHARQERAVMIDCRSLEFQLLPLDTAQVRVVVGNTMVHHELAASAYNQRRATCEAAAAAIGRRVEGVTQLRDVSSEMLEARRDLLEEPAYRRARHVVTENERVRAGVAALQAGDYPAFGELMNASHESLDADYEVSCEELNVMVGISRRQPGALGARMTGAGFGGCTVNLVERAAAGRFADALASGYRAATGIQPELYEFSAVRGAEIGP